jgi:REP element-mobilizing transposase RayT
MNVAFSFMYHIMFACLYRRLHLYHMLLRCASSIYSDHNDMLDVSL